MRPLLTGAAALPRALRFLGGRPALWRYVSIPIAVNLVVGAVLYTLLLTGGFRLLDATLGQEGTLQTFLRIVFALLLLVALGFLVVRFGVVLGSPWYARLSEEIERLQLGSSPPAEPLTIAGVARDLGRAVAFEVRKLLLVAVIGLGLLVVGLVPIVGQLVAAGGWAGLAALVACLDFFDGPLERRRQPFGAKLAFVRRALPRSAGFGLACAALLAVPVLNLLAIPLCVVAGTLLYCDLER